MKDKDTQLLSEAYENIINEDVNMQDPHTVDKKWVLHFWINPDEEQEWVSIGKDEDEAFKNLADAIMHKFMRKRRPVFWNSSARPIEKTRYDIDTPPFTQVF